MEQRNIGKLPSLNITLTKVRVLSKQIWKGEIFVEGDNRLSQNKNEYLMISYGDQNVTNNRNIRTVMKVFLCVLLH